jgi:hypothetical protein
VLEHPCLRAFSSLVRQPETCHSAPLHRLHILHILAQVAHMFIKCSSREHFGYKSRITPCIHSHPFTSLHIPSHRGCSRKLTPSPHFKGAWTRLYQAQRLIEISKNVSGAVEGPPSPQSPAFCFDLNLPSSSIPFPFIYLSVLSVLNFFPLQRLQNSPLQNFN